MFCADSRSRMLFGRRAATRVLLPVVAVLLIAGTLILAGCSETQLGVQHAFLWQKGQMTDLGTLGGVSSLAYGINQAAQVTGWAETSADERHAFLWQKGQMTDLGTLGGSSSAGRDINRLGQVVGWAETSSGQEHACLWYRGTVTDLGTLGGAESRAYGIDDCGQVTGWAQTADGNRHAFLWERGKMTDLGFSVGSNTAEGMAVNYVSQYAGHFWQWSTMVVGSMGGANPSTATVWQKGKTQSLGTFGSGAYSEAYAVDYRGRVVGEADTDSLFEYPHPFLWQYGVMTDLGILSGTNWGRAYAISSRGDCAGECCLGGLGPTISYAVAWIGGQIVDLGHLPGGAQAIAYDINDRDQVVGTSEYYESLPGTASATQSRLAELAGDAGVHLGSIVKVQLRGTDASGTAVYTAEWSGDRLQQVLAGAPLDPPLPPEVRTVTVIVTYMDASGAERTTTFTYRSAP